VKPSHWVPDRERWGVGLCHFFFAQHLLDSKLLLDSMSGLANLLKHSNRSKPSESNENEENIYSKVLRRQLPPENSRVLDAELMLLLMDGFVFKFSSVLFNHVGSI
jgi:hypothetical protein